MFTAGIDIIRKRTKQKTISQAPGSPILQGIFPWGCKNGKHMPKKIVAAFAGKTYIDIQSL